MTKSRDDVMKIQKTLPERQYHKYCFLVSFPQKNEDFFLRLRVSVFYSICARLRLAEESGLGRSALNNPLNPMVVGAGFKPARNNNEQTENSVSCNI